MYYRVCERCGCNLDPGEKCDCTKNEKASLDGYMNVAGKESEHKQIEIKNIRNMEGK